VLSLSWPQMSKGFMFSRASRVCFNLCANSLHAVFLSKFSMSALNTFVPFTY
jgi:hypothetical protein